MRSFYLQLPPHPVQSHDPDREHWEPLWARFCRDQSIAKVISDTTISKEIQVELMEWDRSTADSFEHFVRSITATKGWVCDKKRDEARMYNPDGHYREGAFERCKQHVRSFTTTKRLVYDKERKEARLRSVGKIKKGEDKRSTGAGVYDRGKSRPHNLPTACSQNLTCRLYLLPKKALHARTILLRIGGLHRMSNATVRVLARRQNQPLRCLGY